MRYAMAAAAVSASRALSPCGSIASDPAGLACDLVPDSQQSQAVSANKEDHR